MPYNMNVYLLFACVSIQVLTNSNSAMYFRIKALLQMLGIQMMRILQGGTWDLARFSAPCRHMLRLWSPAGRGGEWEELVQKRTWRWSGWRPGRQEGWLIVMDNCYSYNGDHYLMPTRPTRSITHTVLLSALHYTLRSYFYQNLHYNWNISSVCSLAQYPNFSCNQVQSFYSPAHDWWYQVFYSQGSLMMQKLVSPTRKTLEILLTKGLLHCYSAAHVCSTAAAAGMKTSNERAW